MFLSFQTSVSLIPIHCHGTIAHKYIHQHIQFEIDTHAHSFA